MLLNELVEAFLEIHKLLPKAEKNVAGIILGMRYAKHIKPGWPTRIAKESGLGYESDIYKGAKLARYAALKEG